MTSRDLRAAEECETHHDVEITPHACQRGEACETRLEVHCSCGFGQGAGSRGHAEAIARGHRDEPSAPVAPSQSHAP